MSDQFVIRAEIESVVLSNKHWKLSFCRFEMILEFESIKTKALQTRKDRSRYFVIKKTILSSLKYFSFNEISLITHKFCNWVFISFFFWIARLTQDSASYLFHLIPRKLDFFIYSSHKAMIQSKEKQKSRFSYYIKLGIVQVFPFDSFNNLS